ncbi:MAG: VOC family protein [Acidimicrobiia bacterium]|nr:VOC family protein [Acidimicrobiia bacterium]
MTEPDDRPALWVGHVNLTVADVEASYAFYQRLGMRPVHQTDGLAIAELRGGTHVIFESGEPEGGDAPFDLMVDDLPAIHQRWRDEGLDVTDIIPGDIHNVFVLTDPDGHRLVVYDSHAVGPV